MTDPEKEQFLVGNKAICEMLSCRSEYVANLKITDIYLEEDLEDIKEKLKKQRNGEWSVIKNVLVQKKVGGYFLADITSVPFTFSGKTRVMSVVRENPLWTTKLKVQSNTSYDSNGHQHLTATEIRVLRLSVKGMNCKEIAKLLHRSTRTIENHRSHLLKKLGVDNLVQLVKKMIKVGGVELS